MPVKLDQRYAELAGTLSTATTMKWRGGQIYQGPVAPVGIAVQIMRAINLIAFYFVLAERVPPAHLDGAWDEESPGGVVMASLANDFSFAAWDPASKNLGELGAICTSDGTLRTYEAALSSNPRTDTAWILLYSAGAPMGTALVVPKSSIVR